MVRQTTLQDLFENQYLRRKLRGASAASIRNHTINLRHFSRSLGHEATVDDLTNDNVADAMYYLIDNGREPRTANKLRDTISALWRFLARQGIVETWPDIPPVTEPERVPVAWTREELARLWRACDAQQGWIGGVPSNLWWHTLHAVLWDTGERIGATMQATWEDMDLRRGFFVARAEYRKNRRQDKVHRLHEDTVMLLERSRTTRRERVWPWPYSFGLIWHWYARLLKSAGLPHGRERKFHCIRKSSASYFEAAGGNATKLLGHSNRRVTERYLDPRVTGGECAAEVLFRPGEEPGEPERPDELEGEQDVKEPSA
jgi:integrase